MYAADNDIVFNRLKSMCVVLKLDQFKLTTLDYVDNVKYIGVILNNKCDDDDTT